MLQSAVHPKKFAARLAYAVREQIDAECALAAIDLERVGHVFAGYDAEKEIDSANFNRSNFENWLEALPLKVPFATKRKDSSFINRDDRLNELIIPISVQDSVCGALVIATRRTLTDEEIELLETSVSVAECVLALANHFESAIAESIDEAKNENRRFTESVLDALPVSLYVIDQNYKIVSWNRHREIGSQGIPRDVAIGRNVFQVLERQPQGRLKNEFERAFKSGQIEKFEQQTIDTDGSTKHWMVSKIPMRNRDSGEVSHVITVGEDVTTQVEAIQAAARAEKLAAVGRLAAGVVHEINNPLATISACSEALESRVEEGAYGESDDVDDLREYLGLIKSEAFRCKSITTGLLDFSRARVGSRHLTDINEVMRSSANLINHQRRGDNIKIILDLYDELPLITSDPGQIQQAIIALSTNAIDAMSDGGVLTLRTKTNGNRLAIEVQDTGTGIEPENLSKIYEPFFTTKDVGKGTGLGLAVCYGIVTDHGGRLNVRSIVGKGTVFSIYLPIRTDN